LHGGSVKEGNWGNALPPIFSRGNAPANQKMAEQV
jgi:hypothetical protein